MSPNLDRRSGQTEIILAILLALGILIFGGVAAPKKESGSMKQEAGITKEDDTPPPLEEESTYYGAGNFKGAEIYETTIRPLGGAKPGVIQNWRVKVRHKIPVREVTVTVRMDNGFYPVSLKLTEGTALDGRWEGLWSVKDTHEVYYQAKIEAKSGVDSSDTTLTFQPLP